MDSRGLYFSGFARDFDLLRSIDQPNLNHCEKKLFELFKKDVEQSRAEHFNRFNPNSWTFYALLSLSLCTSSSRSLPSIFITNLK